jgi:hypothetical protein
MTILNNRDHNDNARARIVIMKVLLLVLAVSNVANSFVMVPIHPNSIYPSSLVSKFPMPTTTPWLTTFNLVTTPEPKTSPSRSNNSSSRTFTSSRLFGGGFGGKTSSTTTSASGSGGKGEDKKKKKEGMVKLKPKQQWDRYLSFKNEPKIRVAVRVVEDDNDEWLEVGRVRTTMNQLTELAVARQRAIIAEVSYTVINKQQKIDFMERKWDR